MKRFWRILLATVLLGSLALGCRLEEGLRQEPLNLYDIGPITLDPAVSGEVASHSYIMQIFSGLVGFDQDLRAVPDIARRWEISHDGKSYTFYLRQGVRFHSGREVKAGDFKYSWERACSPETGSLTAATYLGDIVGVREVLEGEAEGIRGVQVMDDYTLKVTIDAPKAYFLTKMAYPTAFVVDKANVESREEWWHQPNGSGPFRLREWQEGRLLILERNELYYGEKARVPLVAFQLWGGAPMIMYEKGEIDVAAVPLPYIDRAREPSDPLHEELVAAPELSLAYIGFNSTRAPFDDVNIRRAFNHAVDKGKIVDLVFKGTVEKADGILPPGMPGYNPGLQGLGYDVERARQLIAASDYGDVSRLPLITITVSGWGGNIPPAVEAIVHEWRQNLGVEVKVRQLEPEIFLYHLGEEKDEMFYTGWIADYPDPQDFLDLLFYTDSGDNKGEYSNPEIDALLEIARTEQDSPRRLERYQEIEQRLITDAACLPLWSGRSYLLVKPYIKGYQVSPLGYPLLKGVRIEETISQGEGR
jgi:oligopeptide transport system substrate-binding protein